MFQLVIQYQMFISENMHASNKIQPEQLYLGICMYLNIQTRMWQYLMKKRDHEFEQDQGRIFGKFWREKRELDIELT